jgi:hypothetical protein
MKCVRMFVRSRFTRTRYSLRLFIYLFIYLLGPAVIITANNVSMFTSVTVVTVAAVVGCLCYHSYFISIMA